MFSVRDITECSTVDEANLDLSVPSLNRTLTCINNQTKTSSEPINKNPLTWNCPKRNWSKWHRPCLISYGTTELFSVWWKKINGECVRSWFWRSFACRCPRWQWRTRVVMLWTILMMEGWAITDKILPRWVVGCAVNRTMVVKGLEKKRRSFEVVVLGFVGGLTVKRVSLRVVTAEVVCRWVLWRKQKVKDGGWGGDEERVWRRERWRAADACNEGDGG